MVDAARELGLQDTGHLLGIMREKGLPLPAINFIEVDRPSEREFRRAENTCDSILTRRRMRSPVVAGEWPSIEVFEAQVWARVDCVFACIVESRIAARAMKSNW